MVREIDVRNNELKNILCTMSTNVMIGGATLFDFMHSIPKNALSYLPLVEIRQNIKKKVENHCHPEQFLLKQEDVKELRTLYNNYLKSVFQVFLKHQINAPLEVADYFEKALWNGCFSQDGTFDYNGDGHKKNMRILTGERVMSGVGCCRHISALFEDFLDNYSFENSFVVCGKHKNDVIPVHAVNLLEVNGKKMVRDITCKRSYLFVSKNKLTSVDGKHCLFLTPEQSFRTNRLLEKLPALTQEEYQNIQAEKSIIPKEREFDKDMQQLNQQSASQLMRICQIEESYSIPEVKKAKVLQK